MCVHAQLLSHVRLFATPWTVICQALLFMETSKQEYWSRLPFLGDLPSTGIQSMLPVSPALADDSTTEPPQSFLFLLFSALHHSPSNGLWGFHDLASGPLWPYHSPTPATLDSLLFLQPPQASICFRAFAVLSPLLFHTGEGTASLWTRLVEVMEFQLSYLKS